MVPIGAGTEAAAVARPAFSVTETSPRGAAYSTPNAWARAAAPAMSTAVM